MSYGWYPTSARFRKIPQTIRKIPKTIRKIPQNSGKKKRKILKFKIRKNQKRIR